MGYASRAGHARTNARSPRAHAICDRCGRRFNHIDLHWQFDWRGATLQNTRLLVCRSCEDAPNPQLRTITLPADPVPIMNPRPENFVAAEANYRFTQGNTVDPITGIPVIGGDMRITNEDSYSPLEVDVGAEGANPVGVYALSGGPEIMIGSPAVENRTRVTQQTGEPPPGLNPLPGTDPIAPGNDDPGLPYENTDVPHTGQGQ